jgi:hypothetical protein
MKIIVCCFVYYFMPVVGFAMHHNLIDFTQPIEHHTLVSDATERAAGKSYGAFDFQNGINEKKYYFFSYLDPLPNGAAFVSVDIPIALKLTVNQSLCLIAKGLQTQPSIFQLIIKNKTSVQENFTYTQAFTIEDKQQMLRFDLRNFVASYRGKIVPEKPPLDGSSIQSIGIRVVGRNGPSQKILQQGLYGLALYQLSICPS